MSKPSARDLVHADLASCGWAGSAHHLEGVAGQLERARTGEVDHLAVCPATDIPVAKGGVDYQAKDGVGTLWQPAVHPAFSQSPTIPFHRFAKSTRSSDVMSRATARRDRMSVSGKIRVLSARAAVSLSLSAARISRAAGTGQT